MTVSKLFIRLTWNTHGDVAPLPSDVRVHGVAPRSAVVSSVRVTAIVPRSLHASIGEHGVLRVDVLLGGLARPELTDDPLVGHVESSNVFGTDAGTLAYGR